MASIFKYDRWSIGAYLLIAHEISIFLLQAKFLENSQSWFGSPSVSHFAPGEYRLRIMYYKSMVNQL